MSQAVLKIKAILFVFQVVFTAKIFRIFSATAPHLKEYLRTNLNRTLKYIARESASDLFSFVREFSSARDS